MNRTVEYEENLRKIEMLRNEAIACRTMARAYSDYSLLIREMSYGTLADNARDDLAGIAEQRAHQWRQKAEDKTTEADRRERDGI